MTYLSLLIGLLGLAVALASFVWSWWLNRRVISVTFRWIRSTNDDSLKLAITLNNLSARTTMITNFALKSGTTVVTDSGYDYASVEENRRNKLQAGTISNPSANGGWDLFNELNPIVPDIQQLHPDSPRSASKNFLETVALFGNSSLHYTYWFSAKTYPALLSITSSDFINGLHKTISFKIPAVPNEVKQSSNIKNEDN